MARPLSPIFFITNCRRESRKSTAPPRRTTGAIRFIVVTHDHRRRLHHHHHADARPPSPFASSLTLASSSRLLGADLRSGGVGPARRRHASLLPPAPVAVDGLDGGGALQRQPTKQLRPATDGRSGLKESMPGKCMHNLGRFLS
ncbi:hypothetical protein VPH35_130934 [Triticum aestivum]